MAELTYIQAISDALRTEMRRDPRVFVLGEDVGVYGGAFKVSLGFQEEFGPWRVIDTPLSETAIVGDRVTLYQGVTLGAKSFQVDKATGHLVKGVPRHPILEDDVTIYASATVLGRITVGKGSVIGGNVWLVHSVPANTRIMVTPPQEIHIDPASEDRQA